MKFTSQQLQDSSRVLREAGCELTPEQMGQTWNEVIDLMRSRRPELAGWTDEEVWDLFHEMCTETE